MLKNICVFCASRTGNNPLYAEVATEVGRLMAEQKRTIVYGGGRVGLMGALANGAIAAGGDVIGVIPRSLQEKELGHTGITELHVVDTMHTRKAMMAERADGFMALPGGLGTFEEIFETATWTLLGIQDKPLGFLNINGYYDSIIAQLDAAEKAGFLWPEERGLVLVDEDPVNLLKKLDEFRRTSKPKWMTLTQS